MATACSERASRTVRFRTLALPFLSPSPMLRLSRLRLRSTLSRSSKCPWERAALSFFFSLSLSLFLTRSLSLSHTHTNAYLFYAHTLPLSFLDFFFPPIFAYFPLCFRNHVCVIFENRKILCWGTNTNGQLGLSTTVSGVQTSTLTTAVPVSLASYVSFSDATLKVAQVSASSSTTCGNIYHIIK